MTKAKIEPSMSDEIEAMTACWQAIAKLKNYDSELRVAHYILDRLKDDKKRKYAND
jgi:hypothetical protein